MKRYRIVLSTFGSLGDLFPYIAIARELQRRGHDPLIASFDIYSEFVTQAGIRFSPLRPSTQILGDRDEIMRRLFGSRRGAEYLVRELFMRHIRDTWEDLFPLAQAADLLVTHPVVFAGPLIAEKLSRPWASSVLAPMSLFSAEEPPLIGPAPWLRGFRKLGVGPYRFVFDNLVRRMGRSWEAPLRALRAGMGLPPTDRVAQFEGQYSPYLNLALFSRTLSDPLPDWPVNTVVCGFASYDGPPADAALQNRIDQFVAAGDPPLVFGLGSSAVHVAGDFWRHAIQATHQLGRRAILLTGVRPESMGRLPPDILALEYAPYSAVFPHAAVIIHQAGIGTLAQALAAGRPQLITPLAFDQPDNAERAVRLGVARSLPFARSSTAGLLSEIKELLRLSAYEQRAAHIAQQVRQENGAVTASNALERLLARASH